MKKIRDMNVNMADSEEDDIIDVVDRTNAELRAQPVIERGKIVSSATDGGKKKNNDDGANGRSVHKKAEAGSTSSVCGKRKVVLSNRRNERSPKKTRRTEETGVTTE